MKSVEYSEQRRQAAQRTHAGEHSDKLYLAPAAELEVVVQRRHLEKALAVRRLEVDDLQNVGQRLADVDKADGDQHLSLIHI